MNDNNSHSDLHRKLGEWFAAIGNDKRTAFVRRMFNRLSRDNIRNIMPRALELVASPEKQQHFRQEVNQWINRTGNQELVTRVKQFFGFFTSDKISKVQKTIIAVVLLYVITPLDLVPDAFPVLGWVDDLTLLTMALNYIMEQMGMIARKEEEHLTSPPTHKKR